MPWTKEQSLAYNREWRKKKRIANPEWWNARNKRYRFNLRSRLLEKLGGKCSCCGENAQEFLQFDHVEGGGSLDRKENSTTQIQLRMLREDCKGMRILCANCNAAFGYYGYCPHQGVK